MAEKLRIGESAFPVRKLGVSTLPQLAQDVVDENIKVPDLPSRTREELEATFADEILELKEAAYDGAFSKGYEEGRLAAEEDFKIQKDKWQKDAERKQLELDDIIEKLDEVLTNLQSAVDDALNKMEPAAVAIAFAGLTRLLGESEHYRERLAQQVHYALEQFGHDTPTRILLNPSDILRIKSIEKLDSWSEKFTQEASLKPGSCIIEAGPRSLEASLNEQLAILSQTLLKLSQA